MINTPSRGLRARAGTVVGIFLAAGLVACQPRSEVVAPTAATAGMSAERLQRLDTHFHKLVDEGKIAGVVTWIARRGQVVHEDAYGLADIAANKAQMDQWVATAAKAK